MEDARNMIGWGLGGWGWWGWGGGGVIVLAILSYFFCPVGLVVNITGYVGYHMNLSYRFLSGYVNNNLWVLY